MKGSKRINAKRGMILTAGLLSLFLFFSALSWSDEFTVVEEPKNLGIPFNSPKNDFSPALGPDGSYMVFNSNRNGKYQDLYISYVEYGTWSDPTPLSALNSPYNDESPFISADGTVLIFSSDRDGSLEMPKDEKGRILVSYDLYWSKMVDGEFTAPVPVPGSVNTMYHEKSPSISADGKILYFSKWEFGKLGESVLMRADFIDGKFIDPRPMPEPFNTGFQDLALIAADDLGGFFFSSNRPGGLGAWDLYFISYKEGKYGSPVNLGNKVNSEESEIYLSRADQRFYFCSSKAGGNGLFDIYSSFVFKKDADFETRAIHFDFNEHVIKDESYSYLNALSGFLKENKEIDLEIIGHTDLNGTDEYNKDLSLKRAEAVKKYLGAKGLDQARFKVIGAGKTQPLYNKTGKGFDELNRRTEFKILKK